MNPDDTLTRSDSQDDEQSSAVENPVTDVIQVTSYSEPTTENSLPLEETVQDVKSSTTTSPATELLSSDINSSGPSYSVAEDVTESTPVDEPIQDTAKPLAADVPQVSSEAPAPATVTSTATAIVPMAPSNPTTVAATLLPLEPVAPLLVFVEKTTAKKVEVTSPLPTDLPFFSPVKIPKVTVLNNTNGGAKKTNHKTTPPQVNTKVSQYRPIPSYNPPDSINPYLGEEQDKPIYLPPTFTGPNALLPAINLYSSSSEEDNFPVISRPGFGPSKPKKLDFPPISNTDENFGYQVNWW